LKRRVEFETFRQTAENILGCGLKLKKKCLSAALTDQRIWMEAARRFRATASQLIAPALNGCGRICRTTFSRLFNYL